MILGSVSCTHLDPFVMPSASSGTSGSHVSAGNFPVTRYTVDHGCTPVSLTPKLSSGSKLIRFRAYMQTDSRYSLSQRVSIVFGA